MLCVSQGDEGPQGEKGMAATPGTPVSKKSLFLFLCNIFSFSSREHLD